MGTEFNLILDAITLGAGVYLILFPQKAYMLGRRDPRGEVKMPPRWPLISRLIGVAAVLLGAVLFYFDLR